MAATHLSGGSTTTAITRRRAPVYWPWLLILAAWALALLATLTGRRVLIDHHYLLEESGLPWAVALAIFLACWQVMTAAMMLPASLPTLTMLVYASRKQVHPRAIQAAFLAGYALVWTGFAVAAFTGDTLIHRLVDTWPWLATHTFLIGATTLALAGAFQVSPLKHRCLATARAPRGFFARHYRRGAGPAWRLGLRHGVGSLGSCGALMLVMFGIGVGGLAWMALLAGVLVAERLVPDGRRFSRLVGVALLALAALWLAHPDWLMPVIAV